MEHAGDPAADAPGGRGGDPGGGGDPVDRGRSVRRQVLGDAYCDRTAATATPFTAPFYDYVTTAAWGLVWARPELDRRTRCLLTLAVLAALRCERELAVHVEAAVRQGVTVAEIREVLLHTTVYAGAPAGNAAFGVAARVLADLDLVPAPDDPRQ